MKQREPPFHNPFRRLRLLAPAPRPAAPKRPMPENPEDEATLFRAAMEGVEPLSPGPARVLPSPSPREPAAFDAGAEAAIELAELVLGKGPFEIADTAEYIQGSAPGLDPRIVRRLRRGEYSIQAHLDLHQMTREEARKAVDGLVAQSRRRGLRCVLIVHGRGLNSKDQIPVLKERLSVWLSRGRLSRSVLAFATARPADGGAGAVYVLLRR